MRAAARVAAIATAVALTSSCLPLSLDSFLYDPLPAPPGGYQLSTTVIASYETMTVKTPDGQTLNGAFIASSGRRPDITLLYFHGQDTNLGTAWGRLELLYPLGYNMALVDPRGYGLSTGSPSEGGIQIDERAIRAALVARSDVTATRLVYYGRSLGAAMAIDLASAEAPAVLITESAFTSVEALVQDGTYVDFPSSFVSESSWDNLAKVPGIASPYLLFHGAADLFIQPRYSVELAAAHPGVTDLVMVPGADHTNVPETMGPAAYQAAIQGFVEAAIPAP
jgi:hypothetical protein